MITKRIVIKAVHTLVLLFSINLVFAALPSSLNYQAYLTDNNGLPIDGTVNITFSLYDVDVGGIPLWTATHTMSVNQGVFSVELGGSIPFPIGIFDNPLWLGLTVIPDRNIR